MSSMKLRGVAVAIVLGSGASFGCNWQSDAPSTGSESRVATTKQSLEPGWTPSNLLPSAWFAASSSDYVPVRDASNNVTGYKWIDRTTNHRDATTPSTSSGSWPTLTGGGGSTTLHFNGGNVLSVPTWPGAPAGPNADFGVLAVFRSAIPQDAAIAGWWDVNGGGLFWADVKNSNGLTLLDLNRTYSLGSSQMYTRPHDLGTGYHVAAWRYNAGALTMQLTVDGTTSTSNALTAIADLPTMPLIIGAKSLLPTGLFNGDISELVVVGHTLLDSDVENYTEYARLTWTDQGLPTQGSNDPCTKADGTAIPEGPPYVRCDDANPHTYGDSCSAGSCLGTLSRAGSPADLTPLAWYHAGAQEVALTDGRVSTWFDRSTNRRDLSAGFYNARPTHEDHGWDGAEKPALNFHGYNVLRRTGWTGTPGGSASAFTAYAVLRSSGPQTAALLSWSNTDGYARASGQIKTSATGTALELFRSDDNGIGQDFIDNVNPDLDTSSHVVVWRYSPETAKFTVDGRTANITGPLPVGTITPSELLVGAANDITSSLFNGYIAELAVIAGALPDTRVTKLSQYAADEWGGIALCPADCTDKACGAADGCGGICDCADIPVRPFVNCITEVGSGAFAALFGYESTATNRVTVDAGTLNHIEPGSSLPDAQPPTQFSSGLNATAFWAPLDAGTDSVDWVLGAGRAHATLDSPGCTVNAYPPPTAPAAQRGETHSAPAASTPTPTSYFDAGGVVAAARMASPVRGTTSRAPAGASATTSASTTSLLPSEFAPPFKVTLKLLIVGTDGCLASRDVNAELYIDGVYAGRQHVYDDGCVFCVDNCAYDWRKDLSVPFQVDVLPSNRDIPVRIRLLEVDDASADDVVLDQTFMINNVNGQPDLLCSDQGKDGWNVCFTAQQTGFSDYPEPRLCATLKASYMDSNLGEDDPGTEVPGAGYREYPASFAHVYVNVAGPLGSTSTFTFLDADGCVPAGVLEKKDFPYVAGAAAGDPGSLDISMDFDVSNGAGGGLRRPDGVHYVIYSKNYSVQFTSSNSHPGDVPLDTWTDSGIWKLPPARIDMRVPVLSPVTNIVATLGTLLARDDMGYQVDDPSTPDFDESLYFVKQGGDDCTFVDLFGRQYCESHGGSGELSISYQLPKPDAPACRADSDCTGGTLCYEATCAAAPPGTPCQSGGFGAADQIPFGGTDKPCTQNSSTCFCAQTDDSRWKFVIAHEAGHQVEDRAIGSLPSVSYAFVCPPNTTCTGRTGELGHNSPLLSDPPLVPEMAPFCSCQYVVSANGLHCLQSIERVGTAQAEGFGQFFASRAWNKQDEADCSFGYYKEFLDRSCQTSNCQTVDAAGETGFINSPPFRVNCLDAFKWRNRNCPIDPQMGTELDWMEMLYTLNSVGAERSSMADIFKFYRQACLPPGAAPTTNPPPCVLNGSESFDVGWAAIPPALDVLTNGVACKVDSDCQTASWSCRDQTVGSIAPCTNDACTCKMVQACTTNADCGSGTTCRDDATGSPEPCTDGTCVCKPSVACTTDADCSFVYHGHCRDDSLGFPDCTDGSCLCITYPQASFRDGAVAQYANDPVRAQAVNQLGDQFGVSLSLAP